eukprot:153824-Pyramimonas_sp.AAC.1
MGEGALPRAPLPTAKGHRQLQLTPLRLALMMTYSITNIQGHTFKGTRAILTQLHSHTRTRATHTHDKTLVHLHQGDTTSEPHDRCKSKRLNGLD